VTVENGQTEYVTADLTNEDLDGDGLLDYYEENGYRDGFGNWHAPDSSLIDTDGDGIKIPGAIACYTGKFPWKARELGDRPGSIRNALRGGTPPGSPQAGSKRSRGSLPDITAIGSHAGLIRPTCTAARSFGIGSQENNGSRVIHCP